MAIGSKLNYTERKNAELEPQDLQRQSIAALRAQARKKYISGRSAMSRDELIQALTKR